MWSDELDKKIKEATEGNHPAYDDKAWDKMEVLLDKHLPLEKKRRRFIFLISLLLVGTATFFAWQKSGKNVVSEEKNTGIQSQSINKQPGGESDIARSSNKTTPIDAIVPTDQVIITTAPGKDNPNEIKLKNQTVVAGDVNTNNRKKTIIQAQQFEQQQSSAVVGNNPKPKSQENISADQEHRGQNALVVAIDKNGVSNKVTDVPGNAPVPLTQQGKTPGEKKHADSTEAKDAITRAKPPKQKSSAASKFSLSLSAGPDISGIGMNNPGKWTLQYGIGLTYAVSKKVSIRTGFFAGHKIYTADSTEYHSTSYPPKLQRIEANCLVYEIPVSLIYNFPSVKKHNWFIAGGLSSYVMKKETYDYYYEDSWGQNRTYTHIYKNENSHLFSVINLSGGYQYHFSDRLSLMAEPYVRIPLSGIGSGKVKLNSGGVLFSLGFKPFLKKN